MNENAATWCEHDTCIMSCRPRLFVHTLPETYRDPSDMIGRGMGNAVNISLPGLPIGVRLWDSQQYQLGHLFYERALGYRCRTHHAPAADLFLIPAFSARPWLKLKGEPGGAAGGRDRLLTRIRSVRSVDACTGQPADALAARGGADHFIVTSGDGLDWQTKPLAELDLLDSAFGSATLISVGEYQRAWNGLSWMGTAKALERFRSVPYLSMVHIDAEAEGLPWATKSARPRDEPLIAACFLTDHGSTEVILLRRALVRSCEAHPRHCRYIPPEPPRSGIGDQSWHQIAALYWNSTFCVMPPGDTITRKAVVDAVLLGCIPVLFHPGQAWQWPWHWGSWVANATVSLDWRRVTAGGAGGDDLVRTLRAIPRSRVELMRRTIADHAHQLQWSAVDSSTLRAPVSEGDAFDVTLRAVWAAARERPASIAEGQMRQQQMEPPRPLMAGYCGLTAMGEGARCDATDSKGSWSVSGLLDCLADCRRCERCHFVSYSDVDHDCSWFRSCPAAHPSSPESRALKTGASAQPSNTGHHTWRVRYSNGSLALSGATLGSCQASLQGSVASSVTGRIHHRGRGAVRTDRFRPEHA